MEIQCGPSLLGFFWDNLNVYLQHASKPWQNSRNTLPSVRIHLLHSFCTVKYANLTEAEEQFKAAHELSSSAEQGQALSRMLSEILQCLKVLIERQEKANADATEEDLEADDMNEIKPVTTPEESEDDIK